MVLDLKPAAQATLAALLPLWPTALSYAISYLFIASVWVNHHRLLRFAHNATPQLIRWNFAHLFMGSLVPASTAWRSRRSRLALAASRFGHLGGLAFALLKPINRPPPPTLGHSRNCKQPLDV